MSYTHINSLNTTQFLYLEVKYINLSNRSPDISIYDTAFIIFTMLGMISLVKPLFHNFYFAVSRARLSKNSKMSAPMLN